MPPFFNGTRRLSFPFFLFAKKKKRSSSRIRVCLPRTPDKATTRRYDAFTFIRHVNRTDYAVCVCALAARLARDGANMQRSLTFFWRRSALNCEIAPMYIYTREKQLGLGHLRFIRKPHSVNRAECVLQELRDGRASGVAKSRALCKTCLHAAMPVDSI